MLKRLVVVLLMIGAVVGQVLPAGADGSTTRPLFDGDSCGHPSSTKVGKAIVTRSGRLVRVHVKATVGASDSYDIEFYRAGCSQVGKSSDTFTADGDGTINKTATFHAATRFNRFFVAVWNDTAGHYLESHYFILDP